MSCKAALTPTHIPKLKTVKVLAQAKGCDCRRFPMATTACPWNLQTKHPAQPPIWWMDFIRVSPSWRHPFSTEMPGRFCPSESRFSPNAPGAASCLWEMKQRLAKDWWWSHKSTPAPTHPSRKTVWRWIFCHVVCHGVAVKMLEVMNLGVTSAET